ncbi:MAG: tRNA lysidine(34) synthetase TilS [Desulfobacter sp.]|nr:tRNA lysidine(34) synthetase TilS [Desulfobacter sp.]WDP83935.1 MAG: tRNA lysidine(34) synthetase TilS [Desulfobacter sp.]
MKKTAQNVQARVLETIQTHGMLKAKDHVLVGLSGGPDSIALVRVLLDLKNELDIRLGLAHLNHCLRGIESLGDENFVRAFAQDHGLELVVETRDVRDLSDQNKLSLEEAGRQARYEFFKHTAAAKGYTRIATGHNWDDHVELVLMNLLRGSGPLGLRGIAPVRGTKIIRPLIQISKSDILLFLEDSDQGFVLDGSNSDPHFLRNRVRNGLIPSLEKEFNPEIKTGMARLSQIISLEDDFMTQQTDQAFENLHIQTCPDQIKISIPDIQDLHPALVHRILRKAIRQVKKDLRRITHAHILDILGLARKNTGPKSLDLPGQIRVYKRKHMLCIKKESRPLRKLGRPTRQPSKNPKGNQDENL